MQPCSIYAAIYATIYAAIYATIYAAIHVAIYAAMHPQGSFSMVTHTAGPIVASLHGHYLPTTLVTCPLPSVWPFFWTRGPTRTHRARMGRRRCSYAHSKVFQWGGGTGAVFRCSLRPPIYHHHLHHHLTHFPPPVSLSLSISISLSE
jgi:hypothetical protein